MMVESTVRFREEATPRSMPDPRRWHIFLPENIAIINEAAEDLAG
jgi:hypothetical protein